MHELRLAVAALRAEVVGLRDGPAAPVAPTIEAAAKGPSLTMLLPLARVALAAGVPAGAVLPVDLGPDTAATEIVLPQPAAATSPGVTLPEAPMLDPRLARVAEALDQLLGDQTADRPVERPVTTAQRESA